MEPSQSPVYDSAAVIILVDAGRSMRGRRLQAASEWLGRRAAARTVTDGGEDSAVVFFGADEAPLERQPLRFAPLGSQLPLVPPAATDDGSWIDALGTAAEALRDDSGAGSDEVAEGGAEVELWAGSKIVVVSDGGVDLRELVQDGVSDDSEDGDGDFGAQFGRVNRFLSTQISRENLSLTVLLLDAPPFAPDQQGAPSGRAAMAKALRALGGGHEGARCVELDSVLLPPEEAIGRGAHGGFRRRARFESPPSAAQNMTDPQVYTDPRC